MVIPDHQVLHHAATATLFEVAGMRFLVTAAHVVRSALRAGTTIAVSDGAHSFVVVAGDWMVSAKNGEQGDTVDIAIYRIPSSLSSRFDACTFITLDDVCSDAEPPLGVYALFGFPGDWASQSLNDTEVLQLKALEYTTHTLDRSGETCIGYVPKHHILLEGDPGDITNEDGFKTRFSDRYGNKARFPIALKGMSGGPVWRLGDLSVPLDAWAGQQAKLAAVQTAVYQGNAVIQATRWAAVTTAIAVSYPELRPAIDLWRSG